jgi:hypothetical protein
MQQGLVVAAALVPLAAVAWRRLQAGAWRELPDALRNGGWRPGAAAGETHPAAVVSIAAGRWSTGFQRALPILGVAGVLAWALFAPFHADVAPLRLDRADAIAAADAALAAQRVALGPQWHRFATVKLASEDPQQWLWHRFVWREAGPEAYRRLVGTILAPPVWEVRYATFGGDVVERAEEWRVSIADDRSVRAMVHALPEARPGARLGRDSALALAQAALRSRFGVDPTRLDVVAADEQQRPARTDWSFVFGDPRIDVGSGGEARYAVVVAGDEVSAAGRFVHVPEAWTRGERERDNRLQVVALAGGVVFLAAGLAALVVGIVGWIRHRVDARALRIVFGASFAIALLSAANGWPAVAMRLSTTEPLASQVSMRVLGAVAAAFVAALVAGLCAGVGTFGARMSPPLARIGRWPATLTAAAAGAFVVGWQSTLGALGVPDAPTWPPAPWAAQAMPLVGAVLSGLAFVGLASAMLFVVYVVSRLTQGFTRRLWLAVAIVVALQSAFALAQGRANIAGALASGAIAGFAATAVLLLLLRFDRRMIPAYAATVVVMGSAVKAAQSAAWLPFALDAIATIAVAVWFTRHLRREPPVAPT